MPNEPLTHAEVGDKVLGMALVGVPLHEIVKKLTKAGAAESAIREAYEGSLEYFRHIASSDRSTERGQAAARLNLLFLSAMKVQDYKTALSVQKELNKLRDLYNAAPTSPAAPPASPAHSAPPRADPEEDMDSLTTRLLMSG